MKNIIEKITIYFPLITYVIAVYLLLCTKYEFSNHMIILLLLSGITK